MKVPHSLLALLVCAAALGAREPIALAVPGPGLPPGSAPAAAKCQQAIKKAGRGFVAKKLKALAKCATQVSTCVQTKASDEQCLIKAGKSCTTALASIATAQAAVVSTIAKKCTAVAASDLLSGPGLSFGLVGIDCVAEFGTVATDVGTIGQCVARQQDCRSGRLLSFQQPRIDASLDLVGASQGEDECLTGYHGDGDLGDPAVLGKALVKCQDAVSKAGASFVLTMLGNLEKCVDEVFTCIQKKPADSTCITQAHAKCDKAFTAIADAETKLGTGIDKKCASLDVGALVAANGGNVSALATDCAAHGVASLATLADYKTCVLRTHECLTEDLLFLEAPRASELLNDVGRVLASAFCPAPLPACQTPIHKRFRHYTAGAGEIFFDRTVDFTYTDGTVVLSQDSDGTGDIFVDDEIILSVTRPDATTQVFDHDYSGGCSGQITHTAPADLTALFQPGLNHVRVQFKNTCGANASAESLWLVGCGAN